MKKPLYEIILNNIEGDHLKEDFFLPPEESENTIGFADGAMDGIAIFHMGKTELNSIGTKKMVRAIKSCSQRLFEDSDEQLAELGKSFRAIGIIDEFQRYIMAHSNRIDAGSIYQSAVYLILNSCNRESVKFGLVMLELLNIEESVKTAVRRLGMSDEFTIFAIWNMLKWDNGNDEVFNLAKKVHGWGKIHAVERLEASDPEISEWLLLHGIENTVMPAYSALNVWEKATVAERLKGQLSEEEFHGIGRIFSALLDEGPVEGISGVKNAEEAVLDFLSAAHSINLDVDDYQTIMDLNVWAATDDVNFPTVCSACIDLLSQEECIEVVEAAVKSGNGLRLAEALGIDYAESFFECLSEDFDNQYRQSSYLTCFEDYLEPVVDLFKRKLPLEKMCADPTNELCFGREYESYDKLDFINFELAEYPNVGEELLVTGLHAPGVRSRHVALKTLTEWTKKTRQPISDLSRRLYAELRKAMEKEVDENVKIIIRLLLDGVIPEENDEEDYEDE